MGGYAAMGTETWRAAQLYKIYTNVGVNWLNFARSEQMKSRQARGAPVGEGNISV
jgi:hypothetical protein